MLDAFLERLFGRRAKGISLVGLFARHALVNAYARGHAEVDVDHVLLSLLPLTDVKAMLAKRGIEAADLQAILDQLLDERAVDLEMTKEPPLAPRLKTILERSVVGDRPDLGRFLDNLIAAWPRELAFAKKAFTEAAPEIAALFSAPLSTSPDGKLSFAAWEPQMAGVVGLMQKQVDERFRGWHLGIFNLFFALLTAKVFHDAFVARGIDVGALVKETAEIINEKRRNERMRKAPADHVASISPGLYAVFVRAERYAASDRKAVSLQHVLAAIHDEPDYAAAVERLAH